MSYKELRSTMLKHRTRRKETEWRDNKV